jgi:cell division transport system ATP-binding protein
LSGITEASTSYSASQFGQRRRISITVRFVGRSTTRPFLPTCSNDRNDLKAFVVNVEVQAIESASPLGDGGAIDLHMQGNRPLIAFDNVAYNYGGGELLSDISLRLAPGSFHFLTGPSGAGKSTFLKLCYAELLPTAGHLTLFDREVRSLSRDDIALTRRRIGVVHQDCQFLDHLPLAANVTLPLTVAGRHGEARDMTDLLGWVGLGHLADALPPSLSGGERQRAALARAVIMGPDVILADEPTGNLDWEMSLRLLTLLVELNRMGKTVLIATHDLNLIRQAKSQLAARVLRITKRRIQLAGADL